MADPAKIIVQPLVTEKATEATSNLNQYFFKVAKNANRVAVKSAIEKQFGVSVISVNILNVKPKAKRSRQRRGVVGFKSGYKKAIIRVKAGETIDLV
jgi:large subunit ribosomal protein L23|tara:strand:+ start:1527 stop:1817 length:291 start_codon:yes stop_codon:yes gene_type:complete